MLGKKAALATPISALAAAMRRSAAAISGRRCSKVDGTAVGASGSLSALVSEAMAKSDAGLPTSAAMACSTSARAVAMSASWASATASSAPDLLISRPGSYAALEPALRQRIGLAKGLYRRRQELRLLIVTAQGDVAGSEQGFEAQLGRCQIIGAGFGFSLACRDAVADPAPKIELIGRLHAQRVGWIEIGLIGAAQRPVVGLPIASDIRVDADGQGIGRRAPGPDRHEPLRNALRPPPMWDCSCRAAARARSAADRQRPRHHGAWFARSAGAASVHGPASLERHRRFDCRRPIWRRKGAASQHAQQQHCAEGGSVQPWALSRRTKLALGERVRRIVDDALMAPAKAGDDFHRGPEIASHPDRLEA